MTAEDKKKIIDALKQLEGLKKLLLQLLNK